MKKKIIVGLTGPIAAGKDIAAKVFSRHGALVIDADLVGHEIIVPQSKVWHEIVKAFGVKVLNRGGKVNRKKLGRIVFGNTSVLKRLDKMMHPEMRKVIRSKISQTDKKLIVINAALLAEMKLLPFTDKVIVVMASEKLRIKRLMKAGASRPDALARIRSQASASRYRRIADIVIENNKGINSLQEKIKKVISAL